MAHIISDLSVLSLLNGISENVGRSNVIDNCVIQPLRRILPMLIQGNHFDNRVGIFANRQSGLLVAGYEPG
jgi:hypothetical protein